jgi:beta-lactamase superfamily II metal-dependent hydrolase
MSTFRLQLLPAAHGDCILIEYGVAAPLNRVLIDGGTPPVWKTLKKVLEAIPATDRNLELLVVTHVDADHIGGTLSLFDSGVPSLDFADVWFNGYRHLKGVEEYGPVQGEKLTSFLWQRMDRWNRAFDGNAIVVPDKGALPSHTLKGGMKLTLLSPTRQKLRALLPKWEKECKKAGLDPQEEPPPPIPEGLEAMGPIDVEELASREFEEDTAEANGSSIAFLAEFDNRRVLFGADAHPSLLQESILRLPGGAVEVDAFKLAHHGSKYNTSPELLRIVKTHRYLFSSSGAQFHHPDRETIARIVKPKLPDCELWFNYRSQYTEIWDDGDLREDWKYQSVFPTTGSGIIVDV